MKRESKNKIKLQNRHLGEPLPVLNKREKEAREAITEYAELIIIQRNTQSAVSNSSGNSF